MCVSGPGVPPPRTSHEAVEAGLENSTEATHMPQNFPALRAGISHSDSRAAAVWVVVYIPRNISVNFTDKIYDKTTEQIRSYLIPTRNRSQHFPTLRARTRTLQMVQKGPFWGGH